MQTDTAATADTVPARWRARAGRATPARPKNWDEHVEDLEKVADSAGFRALRDEIIARAALRPGDVLLDVGAGTGLLALAAAPRVTCVVALDISAAMCARLRQRCAGSKIENVRTIVAHAADLPLGDCEVDVVVSNYCLHHLSDAGKRRALAEIHRVLRPGGRLVLGDMMFRVSVVDSRGRSVLVRFARGMLASGPRGLVRLLRNAARVLSRRWEHPADAAWWRDALQDAGFVGVGVQDLAHEGGIAQARKPSAGVVHPSSATRSSQGT